MNYWLFNAEENQALGCDAVDVWFQHNKGFSGSEREKYGEPLRKMEVKDFVLVYQNGKGYVGIGQVLEKWNGKAYSRKLVYKGYDFDEYRIAIDWQHDFRQSPFEIGYTSSRFLCRVQQPELIARIKAVIRSDSKGYSPRLMTDEAENYIPNDRDDRQTVSMQIKARRGQQGFRSGLKRRYGPICQVTGCSLFDIVEAAHIGPYRGEKDNWVDNGLLLRADIHTLFDLNLIGIHPESLKICCANVVKREYAGTVKNRLICRNGRRPSQKALEMRYEQFLENQSLD